MRSVALMALALLLGACPTPAGPGPGVSCGSAPGGACDESTPRLLQCANGRYEIVSDCHGVGGCSQEGDTVKCDTSGNTVGDRCAPQSEGKVRCHPDAGVSILRCTQGLLSVEFVCPSGTSCALDPDGGTLTCS